MEKNVIRSKKILRDSDFRKRLSKILAVFINLLLVSTIFMMYTGSSNEKDLYPDLKIDKNDIEFSNSAPEAGEEITIKSTIHNIGNSSINYFKVIKWGGSTEYLPKVSPDNQYIAFTSNKDGYWNNYVGTIDGKNITQLTFANSHDGAWAPSWYPNSSRILYYLDPEPSESQIRAVNIDGSNDSVIIDNPDDNDHNCMLQWRQNKIVYIYDPTVWSPNNRLWIADSDGSNQTEVLGQDDKSDFHPSLSPNGQWIAWRVSDSVSGYEYPCNIYLIQPDGTKMHKITNATGDNSYEFPEWSEDSNRIICQFWNEFSDSSIWILDKDGNNLTPMLKKDGFKYEHPSFFMDDSHFSFSINDGGDSDIAIANATATASVKFYDGDPSNSGTLIGIDDISVWGNTTAHASIKWTPKVGGDHEIYVVIDNVQPGDENVVNNVAHKNIFVKGHELFLESAPTYYPGEKVNLLANYTGDSSNITFEVDDPDGNPYLIQTKETQHGRELEADEHTVALWHFNEGSGDTVYDHTKNGNNGSRYGANWTDGKFGKGLKFDGVDDYVEVLDDENLDFGFGDFTAELWINPYSLNDNYVFCKRSGGEPSKNIGYHIHIYHDGNLQLGIKTNDSTESYVTTTNGDLLKTNIWQHLTLVRGGGNIKGYLNGELLGITEDISGNISNSYSLKIGGANWSNQYFNGGIDEIRISNIARTPEEIAESYYQHASLSFTLPKSAKIGTYTVYATNDKDSSNDTITFDVLAPKIEKIILKDFEILTPSINPGDTFEMNLTIQNTFDTEQTPTLLLQVLNSNNEPIAPTYKKETIAKGVQIYKLTLQIPFNAVTGEYKCQANLLNDLPRNGGYSLGFGDGTFDVV